MMRFASLGPLSPPRTCASCSASTTVRGCCFCFCFCCFFIRPRYAARVHAAAALAGNGRQTRLVASERRPYSPTVIDVGGLAFETDADGLLAPRTDRFAPFVAIVNDLLTFRAEGVLEALEAGAPIRGAFSIEPESDGARLRVTRDGASVTVGKNAFIEAIEGCSRRRAPTGTWLFADPPVGPLLAPAEEEAVRDLEARALELDALVSSRGDAATIAAKRRVLLVELDHHGILSERGASRRLTLLDRWELTVLAGYQRAALASWAYYRGDLRRSDLGSAAPGRLLEGPFSIDWFRRPPAPPSRWTFERLTISSEAIFEKYHYGHKRLDGQAGNYLWHSGKIHGQYWWRKDLPHAPVLWTARVSLD
jgi:hypothetical protein